MTKPVLKPRQKPRLELVELAEDSGAIFQAVGILPGDVLFNENVEGLCHRLSIKVLEKQYPLYYSPEHRSAFIALKRNVKKTGSSQRLIVYPYIRHFPKKDQPHQIAFQLVGFIGNLSGGIEEVLQDFEFKIAGMWQFIPVSQTPCITVLRNFTDERLVYVKEATVQEKVKFTKASHIPLMWKDAPVKPFRFNPKLDKEHQGKAPFVQITAKFLPEGDAFEFVAMRNLPAKNPPKFLKAGKADKAEVLAERKKMLKQLAYKGDK